jgi:hypothetical protein
VKRSCRKWRWVSERPVLECEELIISLQTDEYKQLASAELRTMLETARAKLEVSYSTNSNVIEQYEKREKDVS